MQNRFNHYDKLRKKIKIIVFIHFVVITNDYVMLSLTCKFTAMHFKLFYNYQYHCHL